MRLLLRWERLPGPVQFVIALPIAWLALFLLHLGPLNQPPARAAFYGLFWGIPAAGLIAVASRNEARRRAGHSDPPG